MIDRHHQLRRYEGINRQTVEAVRLADMADISKGLVKKKLPFVAIEQSVAQLPYLGFRTRLLVFAFREFLADALNPLPMLCWEK